MSENTTQTNAAPFVVKTAAHARHLLSKAQERLTKQNEAVAATQTQIAEYEVLANTLPEGNPSGGSSAFADVAVGSTVRFDYGREDRRHERSGTVVARKTNEDGKVLQYRVQVGVGFEAELVNVFPGQIKSAGIGPDTAE